MGNPTHSLGLTVHLKTDYETAMTQVVDALKAEGFGVLTEIDVKATLKTKLDVDFRKYAILGACNPPLAHRALLAAPEVGLFLPCNVTVAETDGDEIVVSLINPLVMQDLFDNPQIAEVAQDASARLERVAKALEG